jgi:hypothetical protein
LFDNGRLDDLFARKDTPRHRIPLRALHTCLEFALPHRKDKQSCQYMRHQAQSQRTALFPAKKSTMPFTSPIALSNLSTIVELAKNSTNGFWYMYPPAGPQPTAPSPEGKPSTAG